MSNDETTSLPVCELCIRVRGEEPILYRVSNFPCRIGRGRDCDIVIGDPSISTLHAVLVLAPGDQIQLEDQWSTNGIYLEHRRLTQVLIDRPVSLILGRVQIDTAPDGTAHQASESELAEDAQTATAAAPEVAVPKCLYRREGQEFGPFTHEELRKLAKDGTILRTDLVYVPEAGSWMRAEYLPGFFRSKSKPAEPPGEAVAEVAVTAEAEPTTETIEAGAEKMAVSAPEPQVQPPAEPSAGPSSVPPMVQEAETIPKRARVVEIKQTAVPDTRPGMPRRPSREAAASKADETSPTTARRGIVCPHCWHRFDVEEFLFIARHQSLVGDPVLGADAQQRFLPSRFTPEGNAIDSAGTSCPDMACPRCHLRIPQSASEMPPLFLSIVGATASGKSYFLTSMAWELRNTLSKNFAISFTDTDAINNQILNDFEETIFLNSESDELVALRKTELQGELYNQVLLDSMLINLPKPFMFSITPTEHHPNYEEVRPKMSRTLVLYDNAGEHFEPGMDSVVNPTTQHLLHSDTIFFLFDPTKDVRFRRRIDSDDPQLAKGARVQRQETILTEMINRIKKYSGMRAGAKTAKTLVVVVAKCDVWLNLLREELPREPWKWESKFNTCALDVELIKNASFAVRSLLEDVCPEVVSTAESFAGDVLYLPNSALGHSAELSPESNMFGIRPADVNPFWVSVPMLYFFYERGFIPALPTRRRSKEDTVPIEYRVSGDVVFVTLPGQEKPLQIPVSYMGMRLRCPRTGVWFDLPARRRRQTKKRRGGRS